MRTAIYLDHAAASPVRPEAELALREAGALAGNASSLHAMGRAARHAIESAAATLRDFTQAGQATVAFTGGGEEANALGVLGLARAQRERSSRLRVLIGPDEGSAVMAATGELTREGFTVAPLLDARLGDDVALIVLAFDQASSGCLNAVGQVATAAERFGIPLHCDATRAAATMIVDFLGSGATSLALASETLGGPRGAGALVTLKGAQLTPLWAGGGQESGLRSGSQAVPLIAGFAAAAAATAAQALVPFAPDLLWAALGLRVITGSRRPGVSCTELDDQRADLLISLASARGVMLGRVARGVRASLGWSTTPQELEEAAIALASCAADLQKAA